MAGRALKLMSLVVPSVWATNSLGTLKVSVAEGMVVKQAHDLLFGRGTLDKGMAYGTDVKQISANSVEVSFWDTDGDGFLLVTSKDGKESCIFNAGGDPLASDFMSLSLYQRDGLACAPLEVAEDTWIVNFKGPSTPCDWLGTACKPPRSSLALAGVGSDSNSIKIRAAAGSKVDLTVAQNLLFGRGRSKSYGADTTVNTDGSIDVKFWDSDGDVYLSVMAGDRSGECILDVDAARGNPTVIVFQRETQACTPVEVSKGVWEVQVTGVADSCDWYGSGCLIRPWNKLHLSVANGSNFVLDVAQDLLFGKGPVGARSWGADTVKNGDGSLDVNFWDSDGDAFVSLEAAGHEGACIFDIDGGRGAPRTLLFERDGLACAPVEVGPGLWEIRVSGPSTPCDWLGLSCEPKPMDLLV